MRSAEKSEQDDTRARTLEALYETVTKMLSELNEFRPFEVATVRSRLSVALEHMYDSRLDFRGILAGCSTSLIMYLVVPVILLRLFAPGHTLAAYGILYIATLLSGVLVWFIGGLIFGIFAAVGISEWYEEKFINSMVGVLWAWNERNSLWRWNESDEDEEVKQRRDRDDRRRRAKRVVIVAAVVISIATVGALFWLRRGQSVIVEVICFGLLTLVLALTFGVISVASTRTARSYNVRPLNHFWPGDATLVDLVNLAFFTNRSRLRWQRFYPRGLLLLEFENAARKAEYAFVGDYGPASARDAETKNWARDESARLAAGLRRHKRAILLAHEPGCLDTVIESLCSGLAAASGGNWSELTKIPAPSSGPTRLKRLTRLAAPPVLLIAAAIFVPKLIGTAAVSDTVRLSLIVAAVLAVITAVSPESDKAAAIIQGVISKIPGGTQH